MSELKKGDTVQLKSGGPIMTVEYVGSFGGGMSATRAFDGATCVWFDGKEPKRENFPHEVLEKD